MKWKIILKKVQRVPMNKVNFKKRLQAKKKIHSLKKQEALTTKNLTT